MQLSESMGFLLNPLVWGLVIAMVVVTVGLMRWRTAVEQARARAELTQLQEQERQSRQESERNQALLQRAEADLRVREDELVTTREEVEQWRGRQQESAVRLSRLESDLRGNEARIAELIQARDQLQHQRQGLQDDLSRERVRVRELEVTLDEERRAMAEKLELLERNKEALKQEFENLANRIFEQKSQHFSEQTKSNLDHLLNPFREQIDGFRKKVEEVYVSETKDRQALRSEIKSLQDLNRQITEEAASLTRALKGDKKVQGNWGELILEKVLERSGLRKGVEYETQGSYRDGDNQLLRPDVIVHLPDQRNIVIDSKVSLVAYQDYVTADEEGIREQTLRSHVEAVRNHIRTLSEKDYSQLAGLHSPDFVLMFMPIEPAFVAAFQADEKLFADAFERKIVVVTPTTLLATLRTIENIWRYERQSQNARHIADRAGAVYDKLRVFVEAMEKLGSQLHTVQGTYDNAMNTLTRGRGNLISQANRFVELGVRVKKELPRSILDQAEVDTDERSTEAVAGSSEADTEESEV